MRIIAGEKKGFTLKSPPGQGTRPTLGRVRESLFMRLMPMLPDAAVLDLFAGAGTLGLEALSRGADYAVFVEASWTPMGALRDNIKKLKWEKRTTLVQKDALRWLRDPRPTGAPFDLVLIDPPYEQGLAALAMVGLAERAGELLNPGARVVAQVGRRDALDAKYGDLALASDHGYGDTRVLIYRLGVEGGEARPEAAESRR
jgi:16S rRNA (guanine(966)-N(2))-methyltransferase RsmD